MLLIQKVGSLVKKYNFLMMLVLLVKIAKTALILFVNQKLKALIVYLKAKLKVINSSNLLLGNVLGI